MNKLTVSIILAASFVLVLTTSAIMSRDFSYEDPSSIPSPSAAAVIRTNEEDKSSGYVVGVYEGKIAVFSGNGDLSQVYDVRVSTLPEYDQKQLEKGIYVNDLSTLKTLIEDYTS